MAGAAVTCYILSGVLLTCLLSQVIAVAAWLLSFAALALGVCFTVGWKRLSEGARRQMKRTCSTPAIAVGYLGWYHTVHSFRFNNASFAQAFAASNPGKIVG
jgi:hypothetical protein